LVGGQLVGGQLVGGQFAFGLFVGGQFASCQLSASSLDCCSKFCLLVEQFLSVYYLNCSSGGFQIFFMKFHTVAAIYVLDANCFVLSSICAPLVGAKTTGLTCCFCNMQTMLVLMQNLCTPENTKLNVGLDVFL